MPTQQPRTGAERTNVITVSLEGGSHPHNSMTAVTIARHKKHATISLDGYWHAASMSLRHSELADLADQLAELVADVERPGSPGSASPEQR